MQTREERNAVQRCWEKRNSEKRKAYDAKWRSANREKMKAYNNAWAQRNPAAKLALKRRRDADLMQRTPKWADHEKILEQYKIATAATELFEEPFEVDHVIPLRGKRVSGLHVHTNLQVLRESENRKKRNRFQVEFEQETRDPVTAA